MRTALSQVLAVSCLLTATLPGWARSNDPGSAPSSAQISVRLYNYAGVNGKTLEQGKQVAARILLHAGVQIDWVHCLDQHPARQPACNQSPQPNEIALRILVRSDSVRRSSGEITGAMAFRLTSEGGSGFISVFQDRVEQQVRMVKLSPGLVLGHIMAHEIGHLLLPEVGHSRRGLMRAQWTDKDWQLAYQGALRFTRAQSKRIHAGVLERAKEQRGSKLASSQ